MNTPNTGTLPKDYLAGLKKYMEQIPPADYREARALGAQALKLGMETLDLARIHIQALLALHLPAEATEAANDTDAMSATSRATRFFTEAITPIEETHLLAQTTTENLRELHESLDQRTSDLAASQRDLQVGIAARQSAESALKESTQQSTQLLEESHLLESHLHDITRKILSANETERKRMSLQLQDEIAQALLGIHMRMLALKQEVAANQASLTREIAITQRLVNESVIIITRIAEEFAQTHEE